ncbi:MAG: hypothetical protein AB9858_04870 [Acidaminococcaceae bacterium]
MKKTDETTQIRLPMPIAIGLKDIEHINFLVCKIGEVKYSFKYNSAKYNCTGFEDLKKCLEDENINCLDNLEITAYSTPIFENNLTITLITNEFLSHSNISISGSDPAIRGIAEQVKDIFTKDSSKILDLLIRYRIWPLFLLSVCIVLLISYLIAKYTTLNEQYIKVISSLFIVGFAFKILPIIDKQLGCIKIYRIKPKSFFEQYEIKKATIHAIISFVFGSLSTLFIQYFFK